MNSARDGEKKQIEKKKKRERGRETERRAYRKSFAACSTSLSGGNQVDGLPPVVYN